MPLEGPTVNEIRRSYGDDQARLLTETFNTHAKAHELTPEVNLPATVSQKESEAVRAAAVSETAAGLRNELRDAYVSKDLEMVAAVKHREALIEEYLAPKSQTSEALGQFMNLTEAHIITAADVAAM